MPERKPAVTASKSGSPSSPAKKPLLVKLGERPRQQIEELREDREGVLMDRVSEIVKRLEAEGKVDDNAQIVIAMVR